MILKGLFAGVMALVFSTEQVPNTIVEHAYIEKISCSRGSGTGFRLESGQWVTADHVAALSGCSIDGHPISTTYYDKESDYALFTVPGDNRVGGIKLDCRGFRDQEWYFGEGNALGAPFQMVVAAMYSGLANKLMKAPHGWGILLYNRFIPGMSGGPVLNRWGWAVGIVNARGIEYDISFSRPLSETILCPK